MASNFNGNRFVLPNDIRTVNLAAKASTAISVGDLVCWNSATGELIPIDVSVANVTDSTFAIANTFAGVASQTHLVVDTSGGYPVFPPPYVGIAVQTDCIYDANIASGTYAAGTPVKAVVGATGVFTVASTTAGSDVIGYVMAEYDVATTRVRVRLISKLFSPFSYGTVIANPTAPFVLNTATQTLTSQHANVPLVFTRAAGVVVTLPAATGTGRKYEFAVNTTVTSNSYKVQVANITDIIQGLAFGKDGDGEPANGWSTTSTTDTITLDGSTTGGIKGDSIIIQDIASGLFSCRVFITQSGTEATPFSAAV
tara:strand:- start:10562 stop:11497 length:936 start_codon:yes stop_codon:yes gene_type:complete